MKERFSGVLVKPLQETAEVANTIQLSPKDMIYPKGLEGNMASRRQNAKSERVIRMRKQKRKDRKIVPTCCSSSTVRNTVEGR